MAKPRNRVLRAELQKQAAKARTTPLDMWKAARAKLQDQIAALEAAPSPYGMAWKQGQIRYWRNLLTELEANKPQ